MGAIETSQALSLISGGSIDEAIILINTKDVDVNINDGEMMRYAVDNRDVKLTQCLLDKNCELGMQRQYVVRKAIANQDLSIIELLLAKSEHQGIAGYVGIDLNLESADGLNDSGYALIDGLADKSIDALIKY